MAFGLCAICLALSASIASFATLSCTSGWTWPRFFAYAGLPISVLIGGLPWCLIHIIEHLPLKASEWFRSDWRDDSVRGTRSPNTEKPSLKRKNTLAYFTREDHFHIFDCRAIRQPHMLNVQIASRCAAIGIIVAYICQYIELRLASPRACGIWLGFQGVLAIIRIFAWDWSPDFLGFSTETTVDEVDPRNKFFENSLTELEIVLC